MEGRSPSMTGQAVTTMDAALTLGHDPGVMIRLIPSATKRGPAAAGGRLKPCWRWNNCVCSEEGAEPLHRIEPIAAPGDPEAAFARLKTLVAALERTRVVDETDEYLHAVCRTLLGFGDDLEFRLCLAEGVIHVRSHARIGVFDHHVNRQRVEALRRQLASA